LAAVAPPAERRLALSAILALLPRGRRLTAQHSLDGDQAFAQGDGSAWICARHSRSFTVQPVAKDPARRRRRDVMPGRPGRMFDRQICPACRGLCCSVRDCVASVSASVGLCGRVPSASRRAVPGKAASAGRDQASGFVRREVTGRGGLDVALEVANRGAGPSPEAAVHGPLVITPATERFLDLPPIRFGHVGFSRHLCR
jgi:hypothetical protein